MGGMLVHGNKRNNYQQFNVTDDKLRKLALHC